MNFVRPSVLPFILTLFKELSIWLTVLFVIFVTAVAINIFPPLAMVLVLPIIIFTFYAIPRYKHYPEKVLYRLLLAYIGLTVLWPYFIVVSIPGFMDIHPSRLVLAAMSLLWVYYAFKSDGIKADLSVNKSFFILMILILLSKLTGLLVGDDRVSILSGSFKEIFEIIIPAFVALAVLKTRSMIEKVIDIIVYVGLVVIAVGFLEFFIQTNVLGKYLPSFLIGNKDYIIRAISGVHRDGYRLQSMFGHPLVLAQFLAMLFPLLVYKIYASNQLYKFVYLVFLVLLVFVIFNTGSRSVLPALFGEIAIAFLLLFIKFVYSKRASFIGWLYVVAFPGLVLMFTAIVFLGRGLLTGTSDREYLSYQARLDMWSRGMDSMLDQPLGFISGFGTRMAANYAGNFSNGILTIDSYPLTTFLESGLPGLILYLFFIVYVSIIAIKTWIKSQFEDQLILAILISILGFFIVALISSLTHIHHFYYVMAIMIFILGRLSRLSLRRG